MQAYIKGIILTLLSSTYLCCSQEHSAALIKKADDNHGFWVSTPEYDHDAAFAQQIDSKLVYTTPDNPEIALPAGLFYWKKSKQLRPLIKAKKLKEFSLGDTVIWNGSSYTFEKTEKPYRAISLIQIDPSAIAARARKAQEDLWKRKAKKQKKTALLSTAIDVDKIAIKQGYSPLMFAVMEGDKKKVKALLEDNTIVSTINHVNNDKQTALDLTHSIEDFTTKGAIVKLLTDHGAKRYRDLPK